MLEISNKLKDVLEQFKNQSRVAEMILDGCVDSLVENHINYLCISNDDPTKISYLTKDRISKIDSDEYWKSSKRYHTKPGGFVGKVFNGVSGVDVEKFATLFKSIQTKKSFRFCIARGNDIPKYYLGENYSSCNGTLGASCMKYDSCESYFDIYVNNKDVIKMLVMLDEYDEVLGRALLWESNPKVMDRIYTVNDEELAFHFKKWANENGYLYKDKQSWNNTLWWVDENGQRIYKEISIKLDARYYDEYPYLDTFKFYNPNTGSISNYKKSENFITLCSADGEYQLSDYLDLDDQDKIYQYSGDIVYVERHGINVCCYKTYWSDVNQHYILSEEAVWRSDIRDYDYSNWEDNVVDNVDEKVIFDIE